MDCFRKILCCHSCCISTFFSFSTFSFCTYLKRSSASLFPLSSCDLANRFFLLFYFSLSLYSLGISWSLYGVSTGLNTYLPQSLPIDLKQLEPFLVYFTQWWCLTLLRQRMLLSQGCRSLSTSLCEMLPLLPQIILKQGSNSSKFS